MKRIFLLFFLLNFMIDLQAQVPNPSFGNWNAELLFSNPDPYFTTNFNTFIFNGTSNVTEVAGVTGSAVRMETIQAFNGDTLIGALILGDPFSVGLVGGAAYTGQPDSLGGHFRYDIEDGDTASIIMVFKFGGVPFVISQVNLTGSQSDFEYQSFELGDIFLPPDTVYAIVTSSKFEGGSPGSWIEMDDLVFVGTDEQLVNADFENWNDVQVEQPDDWFATNFNAVLFDVTPPLSQTTHAADGDFAAQLETVAVPNFFGTVDTLGFFSTAMIDPGTGVFVGGDVPLVSDGDLVLFEIRYKYEPVEENIALANLLFSNEADEVVLDTTIELMASADYSSFVFGTTLPAPADSVTISFASSDFRPESQDLDVGDRLIVDALELALMVNVESLALKNQISAFPNPVQDAFSIQFDQDNTPIAFVSFYNQEGKLIRRYAGDQVPELRFNIADFASGMYYFVVQTDEGQFVEKLIKQ